MSSRRRRHAYTPIRDYETTLSAIREDRDMMSESTILPPRLPSKKALRSSSSHSTTKTSKAREVRGHATSWTQEDDDEYEVVEKPVNMPSAKKSNPLKWLKKAVDLVRDLSAKNEKKVDGDEHAFLEEPVDVEQELLEDREGMQVRHGGDAVEHGEDLFGDFYEIGEEADDVVKAPVTSSAGRGFRDQL